MSYYSNKIEMFEIHNCATYVRIYLCIYYVYIYMQRAK